MAEVDFITQVHQSTNRDYVKRVTEHDKATRAEAALSWGEAYWDGDRSTGYGGYRYDGRWRPIAEKIVAHYGLAPDAKILDIGCGKAFLLYEFTQVLPRAMVRGLDVSAYAIEHAKEEVRPHLQVGRAESLPFDDNEFDLVISINTLHNLYINDLWSALGHMQRVGRGARWLNVEAYRNEREKANLLYWQLTCRAFHTPAEWKWIFRQTGYTGDYSFIYFE
ncbi:MAG: class I SAM-dependent methyltransferase [Planctomycetia bacterium]|nr:class I SAM-dependent methyltransferase [Planctomycetia bacterium]